MSQLPIGEASQDEQRYFEFILNTPNQVLALDLIHEGMQMLTEQLRRAVLDVDFHRQRTLNTKAAFLYRVATDRNAVYQEHEIVNAVTWIYGFDARQTLQARQSELINETLAKRNEMNFAKSPFEQQCWEAKVLVAQPTWGVYRGKANTSIQCALGASRVPVLDLTLAMNEAFASNRRSESWNLCLQLQEAKKETEFLAKIANRANAFHVVALLYGRETAHEILSFVNSHSGLPHFRKIQSNCRESRFKGWLRYPSIREELELEFLERTAEEAAAA